jgi:hypothetical protein
VLGPEKSRYSVHGRPETSGAGTVTLTIVARGTDEILMISHDSSGTAQAPVAGG